MSGTTLHVVLVTPQIAGNTGAVIRLCANVGAQLHLVEPLGFNFEHSALRRAGLDYHDLVDTTVWPSWQSCRDAIGHHNRWFATTGSGPTQYNDVGYELGDVFVFGREADGLPAELLDHFDDDHTVSIPMRPNNRSINLSNAVAIVAFEAWRQCSFSGAAPTTRGN